MKTPKKTSCGYPNCTYNGLRKHLARHTERWHPGLPPRPRPEKIDIMDEWIIFQESGQQSDPVDSRVSEMAGDQSNPPTQEKSNSQPDDVEMPAASSSASFVSSSHTQPAQDASKRGSASTCVSRSLKSDMLDLKKNQLRLLHLLQRSGTQNSEGRADVSSSRIEEIVTSARDLRTIQKVVKMRSSPEQGVIICEICHPSHIPSQDSDLPKALGVLHYDFSNGTSFPKPSVIPRQFVRLKAAIKAHIATASHQKMEETRKMEAEETEAPVVERPSAISFRVLRTAYHVLKQSQSREEFEELIVLQNINGLNVGDISHSDSEMERFRDAFATAVLDSVARHVKTTPCVSWIADKVTVNGRPLDITGLIILVPEAPPDDLIQSVVIGASVVTEHDGTSLESEWLQTASRVGVTEVRKLAAICTDGQYHRLNVPPNFLEKLAAAHPDYAVQFEPPCVPCLWNGAHLLDLADKSARATPGCSWVNETLDAVTRITKRFMMGKGRETLRAAGEGENLPTRGLQLWPGTRFSSYAARVLDTFVTNIPVFSAALKEQIHSASTKSSLITEMASDLRLLTGDDRSLVVRATALRDLYDVMGRASKHLQGLQQLPWERRTHFENFLEELERMANTLPSGPSTSSGVPLDSAEVQRALQQSDVTEEIGEHWPTLVKCSSDINAKLVSEIAVFSRALVEHCARRELEADRRGGSKGSHNQELLNAMEDIRTVADLQQLRRSPSSSVPQAVDVAVRRLVDHRIIPDGVPPACLKLAYQAIKATKEGLTNQELLKTLWGATKTQPELQRFVDLITRLWLISPPESIVDSMASTVKEVFGIHRQLSHDAATKELIIRWNGPNICSADGLIREVQQKNNFNFTRSNVTIASTEGTVITRHKTTQCFRESLYK